MILVRAMREASSIQTSTNSQPTPRAFALAFAVAGDAMANALEAPQFLDVEMDQLARMLSLVAPLSLWAGNNEPRFDDLGHGPRMAAAPLRAYA
jgi:hypothetical protein